MVSEVRCSNLARYMACRGFAFFLDLPKSEDSPPAMEGTAFGELNERILLNQPVPAQARNGWYFDNDMRFYSKPLIEDIKSKAQGQISCEHRVDWQTRSGIWIKGQPDVTFISRDGALYIDDFKYGWGIVDVRPNWQLLGYAIGEIMRRQMYFDKIVLRIHQPRPHHEDGSTREWVLTYAELLEYKEQIEVRMDEIWAGVNTLETSKACKYCPAAGEACPALNRLFYRGLEVSTEFVQDKMDESELANQLEHAQRAADIIKIKIDSLNELAVQRIKNGKIIPGFTTEERYGDRQWKAGITPEAIEMLTGKNVTEKSMLSPAKVEKLGIDKKFVNQLVDRRFIGQRVVKKDVKKVADKIFGTEAPRL